MGNWLDTANEMHKRHCDTQITLAEIEQQKAIAKAVSDSIEAVTDVAKEMVKNGESKEARMLINENIKQIGQSSQRLASGNQPRRVYYLE